MSLVSLWLAPGDPSASELVSLMRELAGRTGGPHFAPHVTLLSGIRGTTRDASQRAAILAEQLPQLTLDLMGLRVGERYYQCLYAKIALSKPLQVAHETASQAFSCDREAHWQPHLSLLYGLYTSSLKDGLVTGLQGRIPSVLQIDTLEVVATEGAPEAWSRVDRFPLQAS